METTARHPKANHVGFAMGYDFTCILRGNNITQEQLTEVYEDQLLRDVGYVWQLRMGKQLRIWVDNVTNQGREIFVLNDSWGFFQRSFVKALDEYFNCDWDYRDVIIEMKKQRGNFDRLHDEEVIEYNDMELENLVELMEELRDRLYTSGMPVGQWYGPGALANGLFRKWKIKDTLVNHYEELPELAEASRYAYAGGRFELFKPGHVSGPVFQYDINSAYPCAIAQLPNLKRGQWVHIKNPNWEDLNDFSVVRVDWDSTVGCGKLMLDRPPTSVEDIFPESIPFPLWHRDRQGAISFPSFGVSGWYWYPELAAAVEYSINCLSDYGCEWKLEEAWVFIPESEEYYYTLREGAEPDKTGEITPNWRNWDRMDEKSKSDILPFWRVPVLYRNRIKLKESGNGAHIGIKLGLNSLYGKFAQQIGWTIKNPNIPPYHNLSLAGWVTAKCRAKLLRAMMLDPSAIIATETDGIFSIRPLDLPVGKELGQWDYTRYDDMYYYASGFRFGIIDGEVYKPATRGIPSADISLDKLKREVVDNESVIEFTSNQFITLRWSIAMNRSDEMGNWRDVEKQMVLMCEDPTGKRYHDPDCPCCYSGSKGKRVYGDGLHLTMPVLQKREQYQLSTPHKVLWIDDKSKGKQRLDTYEMDALFE
jgi:hypothetical protein